MDVYVVGRRFPKPAFSTFITLLQLLPREPSCGRRIELPSRPHGAKSSSGGTMRVTKTWDVFVKSEHDGAKPGLENSFRVEMNYCGSRKSACEAHIFVDNFISQS